MNIQDESIMVTGGTGFLGRAVCERLRLEGAKRIYPLSKVHGDLVNEDAVKDLYERVHPTVVIHLAARVGGIGANVKYPADFFHQNLQMGLHLVEYARKTHVKRFLLVGTACSYPAEGPVPTREEELWNGYPAEATAPYGIAKRVLITMLRVYREQHGMDSLVVIPPNLYGPGDHYDLDTSHVVPALIRRFVEAKQRGLSRIHVWGSGKASREFLYVGDAARGIVDALMHYGGHSPMNLGSGRAVPIASLATAIKELVGYTGEVLWDESKPDGVARRLLDSSLAKQTIDWKPSVPLREGLRVTIGRYINDHPAC